jgi:plastocyanin
MTKRLAPLAIVLLLLGAACSKKAATTPPTTTPPGTSPATSGGGNEVAIQEADFSFTPSAITAANTDTLTITNNGAQLHNFSIEGTSVDVDTQPGQTTPLTPTTPPFPPGDYNVFCKYHKTLGMVATLTVTAGA